jgi:phosphoglycolate phosphatase-like HAD superfamily hydrolase
MWIFDFDGVLLNSLDEVAVSAYNAVTGKMVAAIEQIPTGLVGLFKRNRFHFQPAGDVIPLMQWCLDAHLAQPDKLLTQSEFLHIIHTTAEPLISRTERFYAARNRFAEQDPQHWFSLNRPFQPIWNELIKRGGEQVFILTNKNHEAVFKQCRYFGLNVLKENIYAGDNGATKTSNLTSLFYRFDDSTFCFIDDSLRNLQDLDVDFNKPIKRLPLYLASWGFIGPDDIETARSSDLPVLSQNDLIARLGTETIGP